MLKNIKKSAKKRQKDLERERKIGMSSKSVFFIVENILMYILSKLFEKNVEYFPSLCSHAYSPNDARGVIC